MKTKLLNYDVADHLRNADEMSAYLEATVVEFDGEVICTSNSGHFTKHCSSIQNSLG